MSQILLTYAQHNPHVSTPENLSVANIMIRLSFHVIVITYLMSYKWCHGIVVYWTHFSTDCAGTHTAVHILLLYTAITVVF